MANKIQQGQISPTEGGFFSGGVQTPGQPVRNPNRAFQGENYLHNQATEGSVTGGSWLQGFNAGAATITGWGWFEDMSWDTTAVSFGVGKSGVSRTYGGSGLDSVGLLGAALNNRAGTQKAWAGYFDAVKSLAGAGNAVGIEVDITNLPGTSPMGGFTPYKSQVDGLTRGLAVSAGSDASVWGRSYAVDAAVTVSNNGAAFWAGLVFRHNAIMREGETDDTAIPGNTGYARALDLANDQGITWFSQTTSGAAGTQAQAVRLYGSVEDDAIRWATLWDDTGFRVQKRAGTTVSLFEVDYNASAANWLAVVPAIAGAYVSLAARGSDANIDLRLQPKGTGILRISYNAAAAASPGAFNANRRIQMKDGAGNTVYVAASTSAW